MLPYPLWTRVNVCTDDMVIFYMVNYICLEFYNYKTQWELITSTADTWTDKLTDHKPFLPITMIRLVPQIFLTVQPFNY